MGQAHRGPIALLRFLADGTAERACYFCWNFHKFRYDFNGTFTSSATASTELSLVPLRFVTLRFVPSGSMKFQ